jgi:hypothetical protein
MRNKIKVVRLTRDCVGTLREAGITSISICESSLPSSVRAVEMIIDHEDRMSASLFINGAHINHYGSLEITCTKAIRTIVDDEIRESMENWHTLVFTVAGLSAQVMSMIVYGHQYSSVSKDQQCILFIPRPRSKQQLDRTGKIIATT